LGFVVVTAEEGLADLGAQAGAGGDDAFAVCSQEVMIDSGLVVVALQRSNGGELAQVPVTLDVFGQKQQMVGALPFPTRHHLVAARSHIGFDAKERFDSGLLALEIELHDPEHDAVVGDRERVHAEILRPLHHLGNAVRAVEERVLGVIMDVAKRHRQKGRYGLGNGSERLSRDAVFALIVTSERRDLARDFPVSILFTSGLGALRFIITMGVPRVMMMNGL
jgi:hypothetical protein